MTLPIATQVITFTLCKQIPTLLTTSTKNFATIHLSNKIELKSRWNNYPWKLMKWHSFTYLLVRFSCFSIIWCICIKLVMTMSTKAMILHPTHIILMCLTSILCSLQVNDSNTLQTHMKIQLHMFQLWIFPKPLGFGNSNFSRNNLVTRGQFVQNFFTYPVVW